MASLICIESVGPQKLALMISASLLAAKRMALAMLLAPKKFPCPQQALRLMISTFSLAILAIHSLLLVFAQMIEATWVP
jgi:hypothetical protein